MPEFIPTMPHGELEEVFDDVFFVTGTSRPLFEGQRWQFSRNMTVVRHGGSLTLINAIRLDDAGLARLEALGEVTHMVKLGAFHGYDHAFYMDRYTPTLWAFEGMEHEHGLVTDKQLTPGGEMPFPDGEAFVFETSKTPEGLLCIARDDGILVSCDALQNWVGPDEYFDEDTAQRMKAFGFFRPAGIGPGWRRYGQPQRSDFDRLMGLSFKHLLSAHGPPLRSAAREQLAATFAEAFPQ